MGQHLTEAQSFGCCYKTSLSDRCKAKFVSSILNSQKVWTLIWITHKNGTLSYFTSLLIRTLQPSGGMDSAGVLVLAVNHRDQ